MKTIARFTIIACVLFVSGCHKPTLADCANSTDNTCKGLSEARAKAQYDAAMREGQKDEDAYNAHIAAEAANDTSPMTGYENMTKGLPAGK